MRCLWLFTYLHVLIYLLTYLSYIELASPAAAEAVDSAFQFAEKKFDSIHFMPANWFVWFSLTVRPTFSYAGSCASAKMTNKQEK